MGIVKTDGGLTFYDGKIRIVDAVRHVVARRPRSRATTTNTSARRSNPGRYLKSPYYKPKGYPDGIYRVGPLARLNVADRCGTPRADQELAEFHELQRTAVLSSFPLPPRAADRNSLLHRAHGAIAQRSGDSFQARARRRRAQRLEGVGAAKPRAAR